MSKDDVKNEVNHILRVLSDQNLLTRRLIYAISAAYDIDVMEIVEAEAYSYSYCVIINNQNEQSL